MRGVWWTALLLGALLGGIAGAAIMFGLTQAFGGSSSNTNLPLASAGVALRTSNDTVGRNGVDAEAVYTNVRPSVVTVDTTTRGSGRRPGDQGEGAGIVLDTAGHILTNDHVIDGVTSINVITDDGNSHIAQIVATDANADLAVIKIDVPAASLHPATFGDPGKLRVGEPVLAIGNPLTYEASLTEGIISGLNRTFADTSNAGPGAMQGLIQSDTAINPGNSGGPLITGDGAVVGINTLLDNADGSDNFSGIGFAVPIDQARPVLKQAGVTIKQ
jgi:S1-C subfamily serine protease